MLLMRKITASLDENAEKIYKANVLDALYFVRQSCDRAFKNTKMLSESRISRQKWKVMKVMKISPL